MDAVNLNGPWLLGALALTFLVGTFSSRYIKDLFKGVPSSLRSALNTAEKAALAKLKDAEQKAIADVVGSLPSAPPPAPATAPVAAAPVAAAPAAPAAPTPSAVSAAASAAATSLGDVGASLKSDIEKAIADVIAKK